MQVGLYQEHKQSQAHLYLMVMGFILVVIIIKLVVLSSSPIQLVLVLRLVELVVDLYVQLVTME